MSAALNRAEAPLTCSLRCVAFFMFWGTCAVTRAAAADPSCLVQLPVYDAEGKRLSAKIIGVVLERGSEEQILASRGNARFVIGEDTVRFHVIMVGSQIELTF